MSPNTTKRNWPSTHFSEKERGEWRSLKFLRQCRVQARARARPRRPLSPRLPDGLLLRGEPQRNSLACLSGGPAPHYPLQRLCRQRARGPPTRRHPLCARPIHSRSRAQPRRASHRPACGQRRLCGRAGAARIPERRAHFRHQDGRGDCIAQLYTVRQFLIADFPDFDAIARKHGTLVLRETCGTDVDARTIDVLVDEVLAILSKVVRAAAN